MAEQFEFVKHGMFLFHSKPVNRSFGFLAHIPGFICYDSIWIWIFEKGTLCDELFPRSAWVQIWGKQKDAFSP